MKEHDHKTKVIDSEYFNGDIVITDPCQIIPDNRKDDWQKSGYGEHMYILGFSDYLSEITPDGDWSCEVFQGSDKSLWEPQTLEKKIGDFSADACRVGIFYLQEILKYNPSFDLHINKPLCCCLIKDFQGIVKIVRKLYPEDNDSIHVTGEGNQLFFCRERYWSNIYPYKKT